MSSSGGWANGDRISSIGTIENYFLISIATEIAFIIPLRAFGSREDFDQFVLKVHEYRNANPS